MRHLHRGISAGAALALATIVVGLFAAPAHPALAEAATASRARASTQTGLTVASNKASYAKGEAIAVTFTVANRGNTPCRAVGVADGTIQVLSITRDGEPVEPEFITVNYYQGYQAMAASALKTLAPGDMLSFPASFAGFSLVAVAPLPGGPALGSAWPIDTAGRYQLTVIYTVPPVAGSNDGAPRCTGLTEPATLAITVTDQPSALAALSGARTPLIVAAIIAAVVALLAFGLLLLRRRRGHGGGQGGGKGPGGGSAGTPTPTGSSEKSAAAAVLVLALALPVGIWTVGVAAGPGTSGDGAQPGIAINRPQVRATYVQTPTPSGFDQALADCFKIFTGPNGDPVGIIKDILDPTKPLIKITSTLTDHHTYYTPNSSTEKVVLEWNYNSSFKHDLGDFAPGAKGVIDPCAELYHELYHAWRHQQDFNNNTECDNTEITIEEAFASLAENAYRALHKDKDGNQLAHRERYDHHTLPTGVKDCTPPKGIRPLLRAGSAYQCGGNCGGSNGDPHLTTFDQRYYDFQSVGEFIAVQAKTPDMVIQARQSPLNGSRVVSVNTAISVRDGPDRIGFYLVNGEVEVHLNGKVRSPAQGRTALPGGGSLYRGESTIYLAGDGYGVAWPDGSFAVVDPIGTWGLRLTVSLAAKRKGQVSGLLGNFDANRDNDLAIRNGAVLATPPTFDQLYHAYADSWRISANESLFDYPDGQSTATFTDKTFPDRIATATDVPASLRAQAEQTCRQLGVSAPALLDACVLDTGLTGQPVFGVNSADAQLQRPETAVVFATSDLAVTTPGGAAEEKFAGFAGQKIFIEIVSGSVPDACGIVWLRAPDGTSLGSSCVIGGKGFIDAVVLPTTGEYAVVFKPGPNVTGNVQIRRNSAIDEQGVIAADASPATATVSQPGAVSRLSFTGTINQKIFVEFVSGTVPDSCGVVWLRAPDGKNLGSGCVVNGKGFIDATVLPSTGAYAVVLDPAGPNTGYVQLHLTTATDGQAPITLNGPAGTAAVNQAGAKFALTFTASAGQKVFAEFLSGTVPDACGVLWLRAPDGKNLGSGCIVDGKGIINTTELPTTGSYAIVLDLAGPITGQVQLRLTTVTDQLTSITVNGSAVTATIAAAGAVSVLSFTGTAGQSVVVDISGSTFPDACGIVSLRAPNGNNIASTCVVGAKGTITSTTLPSTGSYAVVIDAAGTITGSAQIRVHT